jgi:hypothetical protein
MHTCVAGIQGFKISRARCVCPGLVVYMQPPETACTRHGSAAGVPVPCFACQRRRFERSPRISSGRASRVGRTPEPRRVSSGPEFQSTPRETHSVARSLMPTPGQVSAASAFVRRAAAQKCPRCATRPKNRRPKRICRTISHLFIPEDGDGSVKIPSVLKQKLCRKWNRHFQTAAFKNKTNHLLK